MSTQPEQARFSDLGIAPNLLGVLEAKQFITATPIQHQVIPSALEGKDVVGIAQTGTGKTLAFSIPMLQRLSINKGLGLVLVPTRELALQVNEEIEKIGRPLKLRTAVLIGGASSYNQVQALRRDPHVIVATPGRLMDHLEQKTFSLKRVQVIVLDEADRMMDIGFMPQIKKIMALAPSERQTMLFSATMPQEIAKLAAAYMKIPLRIEVAPAGTSAKNVEQEIFIVERDQKLQLLEQVLGETKGAILVFSRTKHGAKKIAVAVRAMGTTASEIHSDRSLAQRKAALEGFKTGRFRVLVATDIAARGIHVDNISLVINYDLPDNIDDYVHRIGRTGRAGSFGKAMSFVAPHERSSVRQIERLIKKTLPIIALPTLPPRRAPVAAPAGQFGSYRSGGGGGRPPRRPGFGQRSGGGRPQRGSGPRQEQDGTSTSASRNSAYNYPKRSKGPRKSGGDFKKKW